jgi:hypothetical protein
VKKKQGTLHLSFLQQQQQQQSQQQQIQQTIHPKIDKTPKTRNIKKGSVLIK